MHDIDSGVPQPSTNRAGGVESTTSGGTAVLVLVLHSNILRGSTQHCCRTAGTTSGGVLVRHTHRLSSRQRVAGGQESRGD